MIGLKTPDAITSFNLQGSLWSMCQHLNQYYALINKAFKCFALA